MVRQGPKAGAVNTPRRTVPSDPQHGPVTRAANVLDRFSLGLQVVQVYPVVLASVAVFLPVKWLRILVALLGLAVGTVWVVLHERNRPSRDDHHEFQEPASRGAREVGAPESRSAVEALNGSVVVRAATTAVVDVVGGSSAVHVDIYLYREEGDPSAAVDS